MEMHLPLLIWIFSEFLTITAVPIDNGIEGSPEITCGESFIGIRWITRNQFEGHTFVKGRYGESGCRSRETDADRKTVDMKLPFTACGVRRTRSGNPKGIFVTVTVIISFHPQVITKIDRAYFVQCFYMEAVKTVTAELEVSMLTTSLQTQTVPMPVCRYEVLEGGANGSPVKFAKIGDEVYHKWTCDTEAVDTFCMVVHTCTVEDGTGNNVSLLDSNGCSLDKYLLGNLEYTGDLMAGKEAHVFKYADRPSLYFNCQVSIGIREPGQACPKPQCQEPQRGKRSDFNASIIDRSANDNRSIQAITETDDNQQSSDIIDVASDQITVMDLDPKIESDQQRSQNDQLLKPRNQYRNRKSDSICLSMLGFSSYAAVNAAMTIASISLFMAAYKRSRK